MERTLLSEEHQLFRRAFRQFVEREVKPNQERWLEQRIVDRETWKKAGESGGYGYMTEYPVAYAFVDTRVQRIFAGTNEIMKVIIAKQMGL